MCSSVAITVVNGALTVRAERDLLSEWYLRHILRVLPEWPSNLLMNSCHGT